MDEEKIQFRCGTVATIRELVCRQSQDPTRASEADLARYVQRNRSLAEELIDSPIHLIPPEFKGNEEGCFELPGYWCLLRLVTIHPERNYRSCGVQWYQDKLMPNPLSQIINWAARRTWKEVLDETLQGNS